MAEFLSTEFLKLDRSAHTRRRSAPTRFGRHSLKGGAGGGRERFRCGPTGLAAARRRRSRAASGQRPSDHHLARVNLRVMYTLIYYS